MLILHAPQHYFQVIQACLLITIFVWGYGTGSFTEWFEKDYWYDDHNWAYNQLMAAIIGFLTSLALVVYYIKITL